MKPPAFEYVRPESLNDALQLLARRGEGAKILAGGQSLVPMLNFRMLHPELLIDINRLPDLDAIAVDGDELAIGALARHSALHGSPLVAKHCPLMSEAYRYVAHKPIRNRGTLGGNISHADPASEMPAVLLACDATIVARHAKGERKIAASKFFTGLMQTALRSGEMVTQIRLPLAPPRQGWAFDEIANRKGDFALVALAATLTLDAGRCSHVALSAAGLGDRAVRLAPVEQRLRGQPPTDDAIARAAALASDGIELSASYHADQAYKRDLVKTLTERALKNARSRCS